MTTPSAPARPPGEEISAADRAQLYDLLTNARNVRLDQFEALAVRNSDLGSAVLDEIDHGIAAQVSQELAEIEIALLRMSLGTYGACERCGELIPVERLYVRPHARFCPPCSSRRR
jgi:RNA polymerase-binding transcription factor DksA